MQDSSSPQIAWKDVFDNYPTPPDSRPGYEPFLETRTLTTGLDGSIYAVGYTSSNLSGQQDNRYEAFIVKYLPDGNYAEIRLLGINFMSAGAGLVLATGLDGSIYVAGTTQPPTLEQEQNNQTDAFITKYSPDGSKEWTRILASTGRLGSELGGEDTTGSLTIGLDGAVYVSGISNANLDGQTNNNKIWDAFLTKYLPDGTKEWTRLLGAESSGFPWSLSGAGINGEIYVAYATSLAKYQPDGTQEWIKTLPRHISGSHDGMTIGLDGAIYVATGSSVNKYLPDGSEAGNWTFPGEGISSTRIEALTTGRDGSIYVGGVHGYINHTTQSFIIKNLPDGTNAWSKPIFLNENGTIISSLDTARDGSVYFTGGNLVGKIANRTPILIVPGILGSFVYSSNYDDWRQSRGLDPTQLVKDPLADAYDDLVKTLERTGYKLGEDLFVATYDWRLPPAPMNDGGQDGVISGISATSITDSNYEYGVDYLGYWIHQAVEQWNSKPGAEPLSSINVIAHSMGGLVTRAYIQSDAYGASNGSYTLPTIDNFIMLGVPNEGAPKAWNPLNDNWDSDWAYKLALRKFLDEPYKKLQKGIEGSQSGLSQIDGPTPINFTADKEAFIEQYVPTIRALLATYDFGANVTPEKENTFLKDLNAGLGIYEPSLKANVSVLYGYGEETIVSVEERVGPNRILGFFTEETIHSFTDPSDRSPDEGEVWWEEFTNSQGDGTVPSRSATLVPAKVQVGFNGVGHVELPSDIKVQEKILEILGLQLKDGEEISTGLGEYPFTGLRKTWSFTIDPVDAFLVDSEGRRFGYSQATGAITEIPGSIWFGDSNGMGWIFGEVSGPITLQLTGLGEDYYVEVSGFQDGKEASIELEGFLALGESLSFDLPLIDVTPPEVADLQQFSYIEKQLIDFRIGTVAATDNVGVTGFTIINGNENSFFAIDAAGNITLTEAGVESIANDFEALPNIFTLTVVAQDAEGNVSQSAEISVNVLDLDEPESNFPIINSIYTPSAGYYRIAQNLSFTVRFSEAVTVNTSNGIPSLTLLTDNERVNASYISGSGTDELLFLYTVATGNSAINGITVQSLNLNGSTIQNNQLNPVLLNLNGVGATNGIRIDTEAPVASFSALPLPVQDGHADAATDQITFSFNEAIAGLELADLHLTRNGQSIDLNGLTLSLTPNQATTYTLKGLTPFTTADGAYSLDLLPTSNITDLAGNTLAYTPSISWKRGTTAIPRAPINFAGGRRGSTLRGRNQNNLVMGTRFNDRIFGYGGADTLRGMAGNDILHGNSGADVALGGNGNDRINGHTGNDRLFGEAGNDLLQGGNGKDLLSGGLGNDVLVGGQGQDTLIGGAGQDIFRYSSLNEQGDRIINFQVGKDVIDLVRLFQQNPFTGSTPFARFDRFVRLTTAGNSTQVQIDQDGIESGNTFVTLVTLQNIQADQLNSRSFVIV